MNKQLKLDEFKQQIADYFDRRINYDDESDFHPRLAHRFIEYAEIRSGQRILDIATGTGLVAIEAAQLVGSEGWVIGADISPGMLEQARRKIEKIGLKNIKFQQADAEILDLPENSFERVLCCSALPFIPNIPTALRRWHRFLVSDGIVGFCCFAETAFIAGIVLRKACQKYGISVPIWNEIAGTPEKCYTLLKQAGFENIKINVEQFGDYISFNQAKNLWDASLKNPLNRVSLQLNSEQLEQVKAEYFAELEALLTDKGIWNDITTFFAFGCKEASSNK